MKTTNKKLNLKKETIVKLAKGGETQPKKEWTESFGCTWTCYPEACYA